MRGKNLEGCFDPVPSLNIKEISSEDCDSSSTPGLGWKLSDETKVTLKEIDYVIGRSMANLDYFLFD